MSAEPNLSDWVERTMTLDAIDPAVRAIDDNPGWRLLGVGMGAGGQTTLTYGWPWPGSSTPDETVTGFQEPEPEQDAEEEPEPPRVVDLMRALEDSLAAAKARQGGAA